MADTAIAENLAIAVKVALKFKASKPEPLATFINEEDQMQSFVYENSKGGYNVTIKDLDSGNFLPFSHSSIPDLKVAITKAKKAVGL